MSADGHGQLDTGKGRAQRNSKEVWRDGVDNKSRLPPWMTRIYYINYQVHYFSIVGNFGAKLVFKVVVLLCGQGLFLTT